MLILVRRPGERIKIGDMIDLEVLSVYGNQIRVGVNAPKDIAVHRLEIYEKSQVEKALPLSKAAQQVKDYQIQRESIYARRNSEMV